MDDLTGRVHPILMYGHITLKNTMSSNTVVSFQVGCIVFEIKSFQRLDQFSMIFLVRYSQQWIHFFLLTKNESLPAVYSIRYILPLCLPYLEKIGKVHQTRAYPLATFPNMTEEYYTRYLGILVAVEDI